MQEKNGHIFLQLIFFIYVFMYKGVNYKDRRRKGKQARSFLSPIILRGKVHIYWFNPITSRRVREFKDLDLWSLALLPSSLLKANYSIKGVICLIRSFCLCQMEFRTPSNSP